MSSRATCSTICQRLLPKNRNKLRSRYNLHYHDYSYLFLQNDMQTKIQREITTRRVLVRPHTSHNSRAILQEPPWSAHYLCTLAVPRKYDLHLSTTFWVILSIQERKYINYSNVLTTFSVVIGKKQHSTNVHSMQPSQPQHLCTKVLTLLYITVRGSSHGMLHAPFTR